MYISLCLNVSRTLNNNLVCVISPKITTTFIQNVIQVENNNYYHVAMLFSFLCHFPHTQTHKSEKPRWKQFSILTNIIDTRTIKHIMLLVKCNLMSNLI